MVARVSLCDRRQLELALSDLLLPSQSDELSVHLQSCPHCRTELEQLAGGGQWWSEAKTFLSSSEELVAVEDSEVVGTLRVPSGEHATSGNGTRSVPTTLDDDPPSLHFLDPSDTPGMLGRLGTYEIEEVVGRGGMGIVLKAQDPALDRRVAIKVLAGHLATSAAARKRFAREAKAAAAVVHDHVIPIHFVEPDGQTPFLVMPFVAGRSLQDRLDERGSLETQRSAADRHANRRGAGRGPCPGPGAPRHQAGQHPARKRRRARADHRFRPGPRRAMTPARRRAASSPARRSTWPPSRPAASRSTPGPTCSAWAA